MSKKAWVIGSEISESFMGLVHCASELSQQQVLSLSAILVSKFPADDAASWLKASGADEVCLLSLSDMDVNDEKNTVCTLAAMAGEDQPEFVLFESSAFFCSVAPMLAAKLGCGLTADCTELSWNDNNMLRLTRPAFGGKKLAHNENKHNPTMATVRKGVFSYKPEAELPAAEFRHIVPAELTAHWLCSGLEQAAKSRTDLSGARIILSGGLGLGTKANYEKLYLLADKLGASVGASRAAVAAGFAGYEHQVGQTGVSVRPEVYVAFGISGAVQHLSGISGAKKIYAVNNDPKAAIHEYSDYSLIADCVEVIDLMIKMLD